MERRRINVVYVCKLLKNSVVHLHTFVVTPIHTVYLIRVLYRRVYKSTSTSNLSKHLIGDVQHKPCTNHHTSLAKLGFPAPPVHATHTKSHTTSLVKKNKSRSKEFDPKVFADMVVIWLLREGLPLALSECPYLAALWYYVNPLAVMHSEPVARMRAKELYEELRPARHHQLMVRFLFSLSFICCYKIDGLIRALVNHSRTWVQRNLDC